MAIYTGGMRMKDEAKFASKRIAKQQAKAEKGEAKRKGRAGLFGKIGGTLLGGLAVGAMGLTGGLAAPLVMGAATSLGKKWADEASQKGVFKTPGQVDKITAGGKYGYGRQEAAEATKALKESRKSTWSAESMLGDIASSYVTAGVAGELGGAKGLLKGEVGLSEALTGLADWAGKMAAGEIGYKAIPDELARLTGIGGEGFASKVTEKGLEDNPFLEKDDFWDLGAGSGATQVYSPLHQPEVDSPLVFGQDTQGTGPLSPLWEGAQGGQVPQMDQNTLLGLAILSQMQQQQQTTYSGTPLEEKQPSTIADHFASQGKTLGGNNTQSLSQMLGR